MISINSALAFGCHSLGLKGAERYDDFQTMVKTWHDAKELIPDEQTLIDAGTVYLEAEELKKSKIATEEVAAKDILAVLEVSKDDTKGLTLEELQEEVKSLSKLVHYMAAKLGIE